MAGRRKSAGYYTQQANYATKRHNAAPSTGPAQGTQIFARPRTTVYFPPLYVPAPTVFEIEASSNAITFYGGATTLGMIAANTQGINIDKPPRNFKPSMIHTATKLKQGSRQVAKVTGRNYIYYASSAPYNTNKTAQITWAAPLGVQSRSPADLVALFNTVSGNVIKKATSTSGFLIRLSEEIFPDTEDA